MLYRAVGTLGGPRVLPVFFSRSPPCANVSCEWCFPLLAMIELIMHAQSGPRQLCHIVPLWPPDKTPWSNASPTLEHGLSSLRASNTSIKSQRLSQLLCPDGGDQSFVSPFELDSSSELSTLGSLGPPFPIAAPGALASYPGFVFCEAPSPMRAATVGSSSFMFRNIPAPSPVNRRRWSCVFCALKSPPTTMWVLHPNHCCRRPTHARTHRALFRFAGQSSFQSWPASRCVEHTTIWFGEVSAVSFFGISKTQVNGMVRAPHLLCVVFSRAARAK